MSGTTRIPAAEITGSKGWLIKRFARRTLGTVPTSIGVYWHHQQVLMDMASVGQKVQKWDQCDESLKSYAHMAVASRVGCSFCLDLNYFMALIEGLDEAKAREVPRWRESEAFTPLEREVLEYAEAMSPTPPSVTDELSAGAAVELGPAGRRGADRGDRVHQPHHARQHRARDRVGGLRGTRATSRRWRRGQVQVACPA